ncbi:MAG: glycosyltransferase, partial [bacterium]
MLRIAIVHHHLRGGGITRVVANAAEALRDRTVRLAVLVGEPPAESMPANLAVKVVPGLEYANSANSAETVDSVELLRRLKDAAGRALGGAPDVWHVHNHGLGKNPALTHAVHVLAREQAPLLLQAHDFAEDGRPENYRFLRDGLRQLAPDEEINCLYPAGGRVHYALLNQ